MSEKIPKIIHYCWFGGEKLGEMEKKCIESWKAIMPDYEIKCWNETNYDFSKCVFTEEAAKNKKWAFVSDFARLDIIYNYGGIYLDTDVEVLKRFDDLLDNEAFFGFENKKIVADGLGFGAKRNDNIVFENMEKYKTMVFTPNDLNGISCPRITTDVLVKHGLLLDDSYQKLDFATVYPQEYFCPKNYYTGKLQITDKTYSIHHYAMTWSDSRNKKWKNIGQFLSKYLGAKLSYGLVIILKLPGSFIIGIKRNGLRNTLRLFWFKFLRVTKDEER